MIATASDIEYFLGSMTRCASQPVDVDAVGDLEDVRHVVADQDDRQAAALDVEDQLEHLARFLDAERRRRLVHDDDAAAEGRRARHRDALALAAGQRLHRLADVLDGEQAERVQVARAPPRCMPAAVEQCGSTLPSEPGLAPLAAEEQVVGDRQGRRQRQVLVDRLDAGVARRPSASGSGPACRRAGSRRGRG